ncbi:MAG TPA: flagellin [Tepidisphaeraceae bacterium]|nr:flagellin [Tepidisphaeraceae bacterium]
MARINTNVASLTAQRGLSRTQKQLNSTLQRLSSGLRINRGADDPAGLIASEGLRSEISGITQAIDNSQRASNVISTAEGALSEVAALLLNVKDLIVEAANSGALSPEEIEANQLQVDSAVESITRISNTTTFAGLNLLNGSLDYVTSGIDESVLEAVHVSQANFGINDTIPVQINVLTSAKTAELNFTASAITGGSVTLEVAGTEGVEVLTFTSGTTASAVAFAVNRVSDAIGVTAELINSADPTAGMVFRSVGYGSRAFVSVTAQTGTFTTTDENGAGVTRDTGGDAVATVNGALTVGDGLNVKLNTTTLDMELKLDESFGIGQTDFAITGGGALFQLGPQVTSNQQVNIGIQSVAASKLGDADVGFLNDLVTGGTSTLVSGQTREASQIIERAIRQVAVLRGRLGAFEKNTLETNMNSLSVALENVTASESSIRDADFAAETAALTRAQILTQAGTSVLATANSTPQSVLSLLQG